PGSVRRLCHEPANPAIRLPGRNRLPCACGTATLRTASLCCGNPIRGSWRKNMTVSSELSGAAWAASLPPSLREGLANLERAYFRHVDADDVDSEVTGVSQIFRRHLELAARRVAGSPLIRVHHPEDGSGVGAAVQVVTADMPLLVDSITAAVSRAEARIIDVIHPIFEVERDADGRLLAAAAHEVDRRSAASGR